MQNTSLRILTASAVAVALAWAPRCAIAETITYGPMLARGTTPDTMIVRWGTKGRSDPGEVSFRKRGAAGSTVASGANARDHEVILQGLALGSEYEYSVKSGSATSSSFSFHTCPAAGLPMDVVFYGDSRSSPSAHARVVAQVEKRDPEMVFESGDIAPLGMYSQYLNEFFPVVKKLVATTPFMAAPGNHDASAPFADNYGSIFPSPRAVGLPWKPYYSFVCGNSMFLSLNSNDVTASDQQDFLAGRLRAAAADASVQHVFLWFHHAAYSPGSHGDASYVKSRWVPLFRDPRNKVAAVFAGHDHIYARMKDSSDVLYIVSGGAGAELYGDKKSSSATRVVSKSAHNFVAVRIAGPTVSGVAYDDTGTEIDRFSVTRSRPAPTDLAIEPPDADADVVEESAPLLETPPETGCTLSGFSSHASRGTAELGLACFTLLLSRVRRRRRG